MLAPPQHANIRLEDSGLILMPGFDFHQGGPDFSLRNDGSISLNPGMGLVSNLSFAIRDSTHFMLGSDEYPKRGYTFVGELDVYMRNLVLEGDYVDAKGFHYLFRNDGVAVFPNRRFTYQVGTDHVFNAFDSFVDTAKKDAEFLGFKRTGDRLEIFRTSGELAQNIDATPMLSLRDCCQAK